MIDSNVNKPAAPAPARPGIVPGPLLILTGAGLGATLALVGLPVLVPALSASLSGVEPKAYWYLARVSAMIAYGLLWGSMALGLLITNKLARAWPGGPTAFDLHQFMSLLGLGFAVAHGLILLGDQYIGYSLAQVLVPFAADGYRPFWVGFGQLGLYGWAVVAVSFYARGRIGQRGWRRIHFLSFAVFALALGHGVASGTDSTALWTQALYGLSGGSLVFLTCYRVLMRRGAAKAAA
jgi:predicted ferric reductase